MEQKTGFTILALTLISALFGIALINGGIEGSAIIGAREYTTRPACPLSYGDSYYLKTPLPVNCVRGYNPDGGLNRYYMCCNPYWVTKEYAEPRYYTQKTREGLYTRAE